MRHASRLLGAVTLSMVAGFGALPAFAAGSTDNTPPAAAKPRNPDFDAGKAAIARNDFAGATQALRRATTAEPRNPEAWNLLGYATRRFGDPRGSLQHYQQALSIDPKHLGAHEYIGEAYLMLNDLPSAEQHLARLDSLCTFGCREHRELKTAIENFKRGRKPGS